MSPFHFSTKTVRSLQLNPEDNPHIQIENDSVIITAQRGDERIMITASIPGVNNKVAATTVSMPGRKTTLTSHPMKGAILPSTDKRTGENNALAKLTAKQVLEIRELAADEDIMKAYGSRTNFCTEIGRVYKVHFTTIGNILNRTSWKHI
jgi:hypothetical protein